MTEDALAEMSLYEDWFIQTKKESYYLSVSKSFMTAFGKSEGILGRLILILHLIENYKSEYVEASTVINAINIMKTYILPSYKNTYDNISDANSFGRWLKDYIIHNMEKKELTLRDVKRSANRQLIGKSPFQSTQMIIMEMMIFEKAKWVVRVDKGDQEHRHIARWAINQNLGVQFKKYKEEVFKAKSSFHAKFNTGS